MSNGIYFNTLIFVFQEKRTIPSNKSGKEHHINRPEIISRKRSSQDLDEEDSNSITERKRKTHKQRPNKHSNEPRYHSKRTEVQNDTLAELCKQSNASNYIMNIVANSTAKHVKDAIPPEEHKLIEAPIAKDLDVKVLPDQAAEAMGDYLTDTLDFCHQTLYTGDQASEVIKQMKDHKEMSDREYQEVTANSSIEAAQGDDIFMTMNEFVTTPGKPMTDEPGIIDECP